MRNRLRKAILLRSNFVFSGGTASRVQRHGVWASVTNEDATTDSFRHSLLYANNKRIFVFHLSIRVPSLHQSCNCHNSHWPQGYVETMTFRALHLLAFLTSVVRVSKADTEFPASNEVPLPRTDVLSHALSAAQTRLSELILSNPVIKIVSHGSPTIALDDANLEVDNIALVHLTNLQLRSSPFHMMSAVPDLRLMGLSLYGSIRMLEVTGNYTISVEVMKHTSMALITSDRGSLNLTFENMEISGLVGLNFSENKLQFHTVDLLYRPNLVSLRIFYKDVRGVPRVTEERSSSLHGRVEEPIYTDLAKRLNSLIQEELNKLFRNVTIAQLMDGKSGTEISFKSSKNARIGNLNDFINCILNITKENITDQISIPDFENSFEKKLGLVTIRGNFKAEGGWLKGLETIHRTADVTLKQLNNSIEFSAAMGLRTLEFGYARYRAKLLNVGPSGALTASVGSNSLSFRGIVDYTDSTCRVTSAEVRVMDLQDMKLKLTGLSPFNWIFSKTATSVTRRSKFNVARAIEETFGNQIRNNLKQFDCRQYFPESTVKAVDPVTENSESGQKEL
ncbi:hypothetical protein B7P43_G02150 [Cryptotermes secundus]|uniref:Uncharacterized protein n=1 Tax=Cryptotermes secundus TaxID=105785 RepID=A0A2J7PCL2_9NEOP|nr:uncharacterized protein LOC111874830 [Cryptotermes secundus]PNF14078.1 hypothetical protein B7P43_G02150 [Cryptotermes secundus]